MKRNRREFLETTTALGVATAFGAFDGISSENAARAADVDPNAATDPDGEVGKPYRGWQEGELDLHFIHTGRGEQCFQIFPDGTTALVDAGDYVYKDSVPAKPNDSRRAGEWIARYISRTLPELKTIDYVVVSHFHDDHTGCDPTKDGGYEKTGFAKVGEYFRFGAAFDRGYPNYDAPTDRAPATRDGVRQFFDDKEKSDGMKREAFRVGALDQIAMKNAPEKYDFHVRNVCANGVLWSGDGETTTAPIDQNLENLKIFTENTVSLATLTTFGPFKFFAGGDVSGPMRDAAGNPFDYEAAVGRAVGAVDVCKANHHSYKDAMTPGFVKAVQARVYVVGVWDRWHLQDNTASAMSDETLYPGPRLMCPTAVHADNAEMLEGKPWRKNLVERTGTVVVKAFDGGKKYKVYYLTAEDERGTVDAVFGPFDAKGANA